MSRVTKSLPVACCLLVLAGVLSMGGPRAAGREKSGPDAPVDRAREATELGDLLTRAGFDYKIEKTSSGEAQYRIVVDSKEGSAEVVARELTMKWKHQDGSSVRVLYLYCQVIPFSEDFTPSAALLNLLAQKNNDLLFGNVGIGKYGIFFSNSIWLNNTDPETLADTLQLARSIAANFRTQCRPFVAKG